MARGKGGKNRKRDNRYSKSRAVKQSAKKAAEASASKRRKMKEEREAGNQEPVVDLDTRPEAPEIEEESDGVARMEVAEEMEMSSRSLFRSRLLLDGRNLIRFRMNQ